MLTFQDAVGRIVDYVGGSGSDQLLRDAKQAAIEALHDLIAEHPWTYLYTHGRILTQASYGDGTVTYLSTSGGLPRLLTLTGGVWPAWAGGGSVRIDNLNFEVQWRINDATLMLKEHPLPPPGDITAPTPYGIFLDAYDLPDDFAAQDVSFVPNNFGGLRYVHPREWLLDTASWGILGTPWYYTIMAPRDDPGRLRLYLAPYPCERRTIEFLYKRTARPLACYLVQAGTASATAGSPLIAGAGTAWDPSLAPGTVIRLSSGAAAPTPLFGPNPAAFESRVVAVKDPATLVAADPCPASLAGVGYAISSRIDIDPQVMTEVFLRNCERHICVNRVLKDKPSARVQYAEALELAKCADCRESAPRVAAPPQAYRARLKDWPINLQVEA